jgi:hypothetical protein
MRGISLLAKNVLASEEEFCTMEDVFSYGR